jgi:GT2 family glycosyltransferase
LLWQPASSQVILLGVSQSGNEEKSQLLSGQGGHLQKNISVLICVVAHLRDERHARLFERTLDSVLTLNTADDVSVHVLVVDNASLISVQNLVSQRTRAPVTVVHRHTNNLGAARTDGLKYAFEKKCEWIAYVDSDIELAMEWLMILVREAQSSPMRDAVGIGTVNRPPPEGDFARALDLFLGFEYMHLGSSQALQLPATSHQGILKKKVSHLSTCAALLHVEAARHAGGFDADFSRVCEDLEMSYRLRKNGSLWLLSAPIALHRQDRNTNQWARRMFRYGWGQIEVARRHPEHLQTAKALPLLALLAAVIAVILPMFGPSAPFKLMIVGYLGFVCAPIVLRGVSEGRMETAFRACWIAFATHVSYSAGMWAGLLRLRKNPVIAP